jgi:hypothetical protein
MALALYPGGREDPIPASIAEIHRHPSRFHEREVVVRGELDPGGTPFDEMYLLRDGGLSVALVAPPAPGSDLTFLLLKRVEVRGTFRDHSMTTLDDSGWKRYGRYVLRSTAIAEASDAPAETPAAEVPESRPDPKPGAPPPEILSVAPTPGRRDLGEVTVFEIRFSADVDGGTLEGNVWLRVGDIGREPSWFVPAVLAYDDKTRALTLSPLEPLPRLKQITLSFYAGIAGADGQPLRVAQRAPSSIRSRRSALKEGADLRELLVLTWVTRGY